MGIHERCDRSPQSPWYQGFPGGGRKDCKRSSPSQKGEVSVQQVNFDRRFFFARQISRNGFELAEKLTQPPELWGNSTILVATLPLKSVPNRNNLKRKQNLIHVK